MKVYLFSPETGIYQGEDFAENSFGLRSPLPLPPGCTTIAPPSYGRGEAPVFLEAENRWEVRRLTVAEGSASLKAGPFGVALPEDAPEPDGGGDRQRDERKP